MTICSGTGTDAAAEVDEAIGGCHVDYNRAPLPCKEDNNPPCGSRLDQAARSERGTVQCFGTDVPFLWRSSGLNSLGLVLTGP